MNRVNVFAIHRCINEGYGLIRIFTEKIRISSTKLWRVWDTHIQKQCTWCTAIWYKAVECDERNVLHVTSIQKEIPYNNL